MAPICRQCCAKCGLEKPKSEFSGKQIHKEGKRCGSCVAAAEKAALEASKEAGKRAAQQKQCCIEYKTYKPERGFSGEQLDHAHTKCRSRADAAKQKPPKPCVILKATKGL